MHKLDYNDNKITKIMVQTNITKARYLCTKMLQSFNNNGLFPTILKILRHPFNRLIDRRNERKIFSLPSLEDRFTEIYKLNYWKNEESISGGGSTLFSTRTLRRALPGLFTDLSIESVFDAPCGDFNWMRYVIGEHPIHYVGGDIVLPLVISNREKFENSKTRFIHIDLTKNQFPDADLMICRDCLFHLSYRDTKEVLRNFVKSNIGYLLTTTYVNSNGFLNLDIETGYFRMIDLFSTPYNFPKDVLARIPDWHEPEPQKEMCLWSRKQVIGALQNFE